ncbi:sensor domain-containing protein [Cytobacillus firmus]|uniref:PAS/PAC sensor-containing diguanylate cyclase/phosphodiesterase n=1 Tax=Cytobacillus firmus DS1 TaxID=1307436 RepID=W7L8J7_CYTFI|nr:EAL domain-containing protein [Cytobacillus firmus]EWG11541.1 PAS/PAC sensor-containing diguanylate cyclase/phosphodiesterase [Cytobacillus firmus DS1]
MSLPGIQPLLLILALSLVFAVLELLIYIKWTFRRGRIKSPKYKSLFKYNPDAIFTLDTYGRILKANPAAESLTGFRKFELLGRPFSIILHSKSKDLHFKEFHEAINGRAATYDVSSLQKDGRELLLHLKAVPLVLENKIIGVYMIAHNKTKQAAIEASLHETNQRLESFLNSTTDAVNITDLNSNVLYMNSSFEKMYGWKKEELLGKQLPIIPEDLKDEENKQKRALRRGMSFSSLEAQYIRKDGSLIDVNVTLSPLRDSEQKVVAFAAITRDETLRKKAEQNLIEQESKYRLIAENSTDLIRIISADGIVQYASPSHRTLLGYDPEELEGKPFDINIHPEDLETVRNGFAQSCRNPDHLKLEYRKMNKNGEYICVEAYSSPVLDKDQNLLHYTVVARDISERKEHEKRLRQYAFYDSLTGAANRRYFQELLNSAVETSRKDHTQIALLYLDCDRFKWVNDSMGHDIGDELLKLFVKRIQSNLRSSDIVGRVGGDEFVVILSDITSKEEVAFIAERLQKSLQKPWCIHEHEFTTTSSIGISLFPLMAADSKELISQADQALFKSKEAGRNTYHFFSSEIERNYSRLIKLEDGLRQAIDKYHFQLVYQPQVETSTGMTAGFEVLLRYHHPELGAIPPSEFIPICERIGIMDELTCWIILQTGKQYREWLKKGYGPVHFSVNMSPVSFCSDDFLNTYSTAIRDSGLPPHCLEFEVTEQAIMEDLTVAAVKMAEMKKWGVKLSLDDFGSGYSSLSYFRELPIDKIKIDRLFIQDLEITNSRKDKAIITSILSLAKDLEIEVICEGVENKAQVQFLLESGCRMAQGYYFGKPMPAESIEQKGFLSPSILFA